MTCACGRTHRKRRDESPPSSRRLLTPTGARGYAFAVRAALIRDFRRSPAEADRLVERWRRLLEVRRAAQATAASTAEHVDRFERQHIATPYPGARDREKSRPRRRRRRSP